MADEDEYMQGDTDMADSDHDLEEDAGGEDEDGMTDETATPVSYTHLTLPTILLV